MNGLGCFLGKREITYSCFGCVRHEEKRGMKDLLIHRWGRTEEDYGWSVGSWIHNLELRSKRPVTTYTWRYPTGGQMWSLEFGRELRAQDSKFGCM